MSGFYGSVLKLFLLEPEPEQDLMSLNMQLGSLSLCWHKQLLSAGPFCMCQTGAANCNLPKLKANSFSTADMIGVFIYFS